MVKKLHSSKAFIMYQSDHSCSGKKNTFDPKWLQMIFGPA